MLIVEAVQSGLILSVIFTTVVLAVLAYNPRLWISDAPKAMQDALEPLNAREKRDRLLFAIPFFALIFGFPIWSVLNIEAAVGSLSFLEAFGYLWIIFMLVNLVDFVIVDWFVIVWWQPQFTYTEDMKPFLHLITFSFLFGTFIKGCVMMTILSGIIAFFVSL